MAKNTPARAPPIGRSLARKQTTDFKVKNIT